MENQKSDWIERTFYTYISIIIIILFKEFQMLFHLFKQVHSVSISLINDIIVSI